MGIESYYIFFSELLEYCMHVYTVWMSNPHMSLVIKSIIIVINAIAITLGGIRFIRKRGERRKEDRLTREEYGVGKADLESFLVKEHKIQKENITNLEDKLQKAELELKEAQQQVYRNKLQLAEQVSNAHMMDHDTLYGRKLKSAVGAEQDMPYSELMEKYKDANELLNIFMGDIEETEVHTMYGRLGRTRNPGSHNREFIELTTEELNNYHVNTVPYHKKTSNEVKDMNGNDKLIANVGAALGGFVVQDNHTRKKNRKKWSNN